MIVKDCKSTCAKVSLHVYFTLTWMCELISFKNILTHKKNYKYLTVSKLLWMLSQPPNITGKCNAKGRCLSFCETKGLEPCLCKHEADMCKMCCRQQNNTSSCQPYDNIINNNKITMVLKDNSTCVVGYCSKVCFNIISKRYFENSEVLYSCIAIKLL